MDIVDPIPYQLSDLGTGQASNYVLQDLAYDYAVGGLPFLSATRDQWPYTEGMAPIKKDQFDSFAEPGEQSLQGWWLRSQSDFTDGAGVIYQDPDTSNPYIRQYNTRYADSLGVDPWTAGEIQLLRNSTRVYTAGSTTNLVQGYVDPSGVDSMWFTDGTLLKKYTSAGVTTAISTQTNPIQSITSTGSTYFIGETDGIYMGSNATAPTKWYNTTATHVTLGYVKARLVAGIDQSIYVLAAPVAPPASLPPAAGSNGQLVFTHTDPNWQWTSITEGPTAIYAAGHSGTTGAIFKFVLDTTGAVPTLAGGAITAFMPTGEIINSIYGYIGSYVGIATNKGFRVGQIDTNGDIVYGPLLFTPAGGCRGIVGFDRFLWTGSTNAHNGASGLFRVDLGTIIQERNPNVVRYAYARDIYMPGEISSIGSLTLLGQSDRVAYGIDTFGVALEDATTLLTTGYITTGRIRFNMEEPKLFKFFSIRTPPLTGELTVSVLDQGGGETPYITYGPTYTPSQSDVATPTPAGPQSWIAIRFTLNRSLSDTSQGAVLNGWQVKALPGSIRQRMIQHTFLLMDHETDRGGQRVGYNGYARDRFEAFKELARKGDVVVFQELSESISTLVVIDDWKYTQLGPPGPNEEALGGYLTVSLRTVAETA